MVTGQKRARIISELELLDVDELAISGRRNTLQDQIDELYLRAPLTGPETSELTRLESDEVDLSAQRRELHEQIDGLRTTVGLRSKRVEIAAAAALVA